MASVRCDLEDMGVLIQGMAPRDVGPHVMQRLSMQPCFPMYALLSAGRTTTGDRVPPPDARLRPPSRWPGVYALYYTGYGHALYGGLSGASAPLYIGKTDNVADRLRQHAESLAEVSNLDPGDFSARWLQFAPADGDVKEWFERAAIRHTQPLWNVVLKGFGNKNQGARRLERACSLFDVLHPGRRHVGRGAFLVAPDRADAILAQIVTEDCMAEAAALGTGCRSSNTQPVCDMDPGVLSAARGEGAAIMNTDTDLLLLVRRALAQRGVLGPAPRVSARTQPDTLVRRFGVSISSPPPLSNPTTCNDTPMVVF
jgi:hypothetical protein